MTQNTGKINTPHSKRPGGEYNRRTNEQKAWDTEQVEAAKLENERRKLENLRKQQEYDNKRLDGELKKIRLEEARKRIEQEKSFGRRVDAMTKAFNNTLLGRSLKTTGSGIKQFSAGTNAFIDHSANTVSNLYNAGSNLANAAMGPVGAQITTKGVLANTALSALTGGMLNPVLLQALGVNKAISGLWGATKGVTRAGISATKAGISGIKGLWGLGKAGVGLAGSTLGMFGNPVTGGLAGAGIGALFGGPVGAVTGGLVGSGIGALFKKGDNEQIASAVKEGEGRSDRVYKEQVKQSLNKIEKNTAKTEKEDDKKESFWDKFLGGVKTLALIGGIAGIVYTAYKHWEKTKTVVSAIGKFGSIITKVVQATLKTFYEIGEWVGEKAAGIVQAISHPIDTAMDLWERLDFAALGKKIVAGAIEFVLPKPIAKMVNGYLFDTEDSSEIHAFKDNKEVEGKKIQDSALEMTEKGKLSAESKGIDVLNTEDKDLTVNERAYKKSLIDSTNKQDVGDYIPLEKEPIKDGIGGGYGTIGAISTSNGNNIENGLWHGISAVKLENLGLRGDIASSNSEPYIAEGNAESLKKLDSALDSWGYDVIYTSAMGGHKHATGHWKGNKVDLQLKKKGKSAHLNGAELNALRKAGYWGSGTGALGWEPNSNQVGGGHYDIYLGSAGGKPLTSEINYANKGTPDIGPVAMSTASSTPSIEATTSEQLGNIEGMTAQTASNTTPGDTYSGGNAVGGTGETSIAGGFGGVTSNTGSSSGDIKSLISALGSINGGGNTGSSDSNPDVYAYGDFARTLVLGYQGPVV